MINFNEPVYLEKSMEYVKKAILINKRLNGDGEFTAKCTEWMEQRFGGAKILLTTSCTHGLEMASLLCGIAPGDEVIMPSYTFVSTANAFVLRGAKIKFVDIDPRTMNINADLIEEAITERTRVIVPVHYAGVGCDMDKIMAIARKHHLIVVEDAAQGVMAKYKGKYLGNNRRFRFLQLPRDKELYDGRGRYDQYQPGRICRAGRDSPGKGNEPDKVLPRGSG